MSGVEIVEKLSLAYRELYDIDIKIVQKFGPYLKEFDLSSNNLRDLTFLKGFPKLETLVLDGNSITSHTKIPKMEKLHTLWVNSNQISNLILFIDKLAYSAPNLKFFSMLKNEACPNFFNGKSLQEYNDYRRYVISRLPGLSTLDSSPITNDEKAEALRLYSSLPLPSKPTLPDEDIRAPKKPQSPKRKKKTKVRLTTANLPEFLNGGSKMGPPPPNSAPNIAEVDNEDTSSDFSSEGGVDSEEWTDEEVDEDKEVIANTHVWKGKGPEPKQKE